MVTCRNETLGLMTILLKGGARRLTRHQNERRNEYNPASGAGSKYLGTGAGLMTQMTRRLALIAAQSSSDGHTHKVLVITSKADDSVTEKLFFHRREQTSLWSR
jgi:hypothetical protein